MKTVKVRVNSIEKVKEFNTAICAFPVDFDLVHKRYVIDAKSIMGIFSLDLTQDIDLNIYSEDADELEAILAAIGKFIVE